MTLSRIYASVIILIAPLGVYAQTGMLDSRATLSDLTLLITQYEARIKQLQSENEVLRVEMAKAGIRIPLTDLSGSTTPIPTSITPSTPSESTPTQPTVVSGESTASGKATIDATTMATLTAQYGKDVAGFISRVNKDWAAIKTNYSFPSAARIAGYEFVQNSSMDSVFVDIIIGTGSTGVYDMKILYQFEKSEYKRKLIGIFDYNKSTERYTTRTGTNPFGGVVRTFVRDPYYTGALTLPATATGVTASVSSPTTTSTTTTTTPVETPPSSTGEVSVTDITKAYNEKRYLSTISLSNTYLQTNPATKEILNIRYRTYFIIGKYAESLAELEKVEKLGSLDKQTACNAQVIATYSKSQALVDKYAALCKK